MSLRWRWSLVVVLAAIVLGTFMPQAFLVGSSTPASPALASLVGPPTFPSGCSGTNCAKSSPAAPTPSLTIAALATTVVGLGVAATRSSRRIRSRADGLRRGTFRVLFHPPQFS